MRTMLLTGLLALAACSGAEQTSTSPGTEAKAPVQELNLYIWTNYHSPAAIARFEKEFNAHVNIDLYDNNEVIEQKLQSGQAPYDIVVPTDYMVLSLARQGLLQPLDESKLPNLKNLDPAFDKLKAEGGPRYNVGYLWGSTGFAVRTDKISAPIDSWTALFDPQYKGRVVMLDDMREVFAAALHTEGASINSKDPAQIEAAKQKLIKQKELVLAYDSSDFAGKIQAGDGWLVQGYSGELARVARASNGTIKYVVPKEGCSIATDNLVIPTAAKHAELAHQFINFMLDPDVAADTTNVTGYATSNLAGKPLIQPELLNDPAVFPPAELLSKCEFLMDLGDFTPTLDAAWTEIKAQ